MLHFENDYNEGAHPELLKALLETNTENLAGYGTDYYTKRAAEKIKLACQSPDADVFFLTGGTQTNQVAIASLLRSYEGVVTVDTGHINTHEAGAIEYTGHKVLTIPHEQGKLSAHKLKAYLEQFYQDDAKEHMVAPGMVYISHPTEYGTLYSKAELEALASICRHYTLPLFLDGARLSYGLAVTETDVDLPTIAELCDVFYIGGTKIGALAGEALVFTRQPMPKNFTSIVKQHGALLAKGRVLGVQFDRLFTDDLHLTIGRHAIKLAEQVRTILLEKGYHLYIDSPTNQQFVIIDNSQLSKLAESMVYTIWEPYDDNRTVIRLTTSWSTTQEDVDQLRELL
ncbi:MULTISPECIES: low specificity L-threonine aldolase [unclassified Streptococcus]|uniref:threonine aldolase family protein n=1 Tax=unclassified Streptococcus TaxID=2608887 RepID=UPI00359E2228